MAKFIRHDILGEAIECVILAVQELPVHVLQSIPAVWVFIAGAAFGITIVAAEDGKSMFLP
ncbi:MAG: hypothetical protein GX572_00385 [Clostridia bacterium]|nr:hypothetical protein [Clostridia bacterium]